MTWILCSLILPVLLATPAWGQIPVSEVGPSALAHANTSIQSTLTTVEVLFHSSQWILDLSSFESGALEGFHADLDALFGLLSETQRILWEGQALVADIERLFGLAGAPDSSKALRDRLQEAQFWHYARKRHVQELQSLPGRMTGTIARIKGLGGRIMGILGAKQGSQQVQEMTQQLQHLQAQTQVVLASYQQIQLVESMELPLIQESVRRINTQILSTVPGRQ